MIQKRSNNGDYEWCVVDICFSFLERGRGCANLLVADRYGAYLIVVVDKKQEGVGSSTHFFFWFLL